MKSITDTISKNFISRELEKRNDINMYESPYINYRSSDRNIIGYVKGMYDKIISSEKFPVYILLNIKYDDKDTKHAEVIAVTKNKGRYTVGLFDPNGRLGNRLLPDINIRKIIDLLSEKLDCKAFEYMDIGINNLPGSGNCDALCLWFICVNKHSTTKKQIEDTLKRLLNKMKKDNIKDATIEINNIITELSKKP
jgi:hypothetical protein